MRCNISTINPECTPQMPAVSPAGLRSSARKTASPALYQDPLATGSFSAAASTLCPAAFAPSGAPVLVTSSPPVQHGSAARGLRYEMPADATYPLESPTASASPVCSPLSITEVEDGIWIVGSMPCDLGYIDLQARILQPVVSRISSARAISVSPDT